MVREFEEVEKDPDFKQLSEETKKIVAERHMKLEKEIQHKKEIEELVKKNIILYEDAVKNRIT